MKNTLRVLTSSKYILFIREFCVGQKWLRGSISSQTNLNSSVWFGLVCAIQFYTISMFVSLVIFNIFLVLILRLATLCFSVFTFTWQPFFLMLRANLPYSSRSISWLAHSYKMLKQVQNNLLDNCAMHVFTLQVCQPVDVSQLGELERTD